MILDQDNNERGPLKATGMAQVCTIGVHNERSCSRDTEIRSQVYLDG
jgi:hypothetical protein